MYTFHLPEDNPSTLSGQVGGAISNIPLSGYLGELFSFVSAVPSGTSASLQYRKVFVKNEYGTTSTLTKIWLDSVEHNNQIQIALENSANDTTTSPTTEPNGVTGWVSPRNYVDGLSLGTIAAGTATGVWVRQFLSGVTVSDPYATFRINVGGLVQ